MRSLQRNGILCMAFIQIGYLKKYGVKRIKRTAADGEVLIIDDREFIIGGQRTTARL